MSKILVTYATGAGSTAGIAEAIGDELRTRGADVDVRPVKEVADLGGYGAVVVGTGVRAGRTYAAASKFLAREQAALAEMPVAGFVVCLTSFWMFDSPNDALLFMHIKITIAIMI